MADIDDFKAEVMMAHACGLLVALGRTEQAAALRLGEPATLELCDYRLSRVPLVCGLELLSDAWPERLTLLGGRAARVVVRYAWTAQQTFGWEYGPRLADFMCAAPGRQPLFMRF